MKTKLLITLLALLAVPSFGQWEYVGWNTNTHAFTPTAVTNYFGGGGSSDPQAFYTNGTRRMGADANWGNHNIGNVKSVVGNDDMFIPSLHLTSSNSLATIDLYNLNGEIDFSSEFLDLASYVTELVLTTNSPSIGQVLTSDGMGHWYAFTPTAGSSLTDVVVNGVDAPTIGGVETITIPVGSSLPPWLAAMTNTQNLGSIGSASTNPSPTSVDFTNGLTAAYTQTGNVALALAPCPWNGLTATLIPTHGTSPSYTTTFSANVYFSGGAQPSLPQVSGARSRLTFESYGSQFDFDRMIPNLLSYASSLNCRILAVGGGGSGGDALSGNGGGGGGGGGVIYSNTVAIVSGSYWVKVGAGGNEGNGEATTGMTMIALGGGRGGDADGGNGTDGACGGGVGGGGSTAGLGSIGFNGGATSGNHGGGGGGMGSAGTNGGSPYGGGGGGSGVSNAISGLWVWYGGGGQGAYGGNNPNGPGGGGLGCITYLSMVGQPGTNGLGGGGGAGYDAGGAYDYGGQGGSGIVIISYSNSVPVASGGTITTNGGSIVHTFLSSGTFTF